LASFDPIMKPRILLIALALILGFIAFRPEQAPQEAAPPPERAAPVANQRIKPLSFEQLPGDVQKASLARNAARRISAYETELPAIDAFHGWVTRYLEAPTKLRGEMLAKGLELAEARRTVLRQIIEENPQRALRLAVPPVVRQSLPLKLAQRLEERLNERAFFGVLGVISDDKPAKKPYRRELRTRDGGVYEAHVYGNRLSQISVPEMSVVGIAIDQVAAIEESPLRIVEAGEIPNHPNNLTRTRTLKPVDAEGFSQDLVVTTEPAPEREVVETCPVSGKSTTASREGPGIFTAVAPEQPVVEAAGEFHYLCSGGHIRAFENGLLVQEGGNGGPMQVTSLPVPTKSTGHRTNLLMRVAFPEASAASLTEAEGHALGKGVQDWMLDVSAGRLTFSTTVTPVIILPRPETWYKGRDSDGGASDVLIDARSAAKLAGFDTANYDFDTVIFTGSPGNFGGQAYLGMKGCWLKSGSSVGVACHEYGHNFGLMHANFWSTTNGSVIGSGTHFEYGDSYDTMGSASAGDYQFNACNKNALGWLPTPLVHEITTSGTYRIHAMDQPSQDARMRYGLKLRKDSARFYWAEFRQKFATNMFSQNGVLLHWSPWQASFGGTHLLDATPLSPEGKTDAALMIGRTFSDFESDLHLTPIAKNTTVPPSVDVVVQIGPFPGNQAPTVAVSASTLTTATNQDVTFTASAVDPQGDVLSYAWDFGRNTVATANPGLINASSVTQQFATPGIYRVRCVVSDMKGKTASDSVIVIVGSPSEYRVSGTITANGQPLANVLVRNGGSGQSYREAFTDSDGSYTISLPAGNHTLTALSDGYTFAPTTVGGNILTVGTNISGVDFTASALARVDLTVIDASASEGGGTATFRLSRTGDTSNALPVRLFGFRGTAVNNTDFTLAPVLTASGSYLTASIGTGQSHLDLVVTALQDTTLESFETLTLELAPTAGYVTRSAIAQVTITDDDSLLPLVGLKVEDRDTTEGGDGAQFTITRIGETTNALEVFLTLGGSATPGSDFQALPASVIIPGGSASISVPVAALQDIPVEPMETLIATIADDSYYVRSIPTANHSGTINLHEDDAPVVTVAATDSTAAEAGSDPGVFTVTRTGNTTDELRVLYGLTGSALHGADYGVLPGEVTIPAGSSAATVVITPLDDNIGEPAQTAVLQLRSGLDYAVGQASSATITITDNADLPYVTLTTVAGPAVESGASGSIRITSSGTGSGSITVRYTVSGTATSGVDFTALSGSIVMGVNSTASLPIVPLTDSTGEGMESVIVTLTPDPAYTVAIDSTATVNLLDAANFPLVHVATPSFVVTESNFSQLGFAISRSGSTTSALTVNYTLTGSSTSGIDFAAPTGSVVIQAGSTSAGVGVIPYADGLAEGTETVTLTIVYGGTYGIGNSSATGYILDSNNTDVAISAGFDSPTSSTSENSGTVLIPVSLDAPSAGPVTVYYELSGGTALGAGMDFSAGSGSLVFAPGQVLKTIPVMISDDPVDEPDETVVVKLSYANQAKISTAQHTLTILDNDSPVPVSIGFAGTTSTAREESGSTGIPVALSTAQLSSVTVNFAVTGGTATSGTDYSFSPGTLTFLPGETVKMVPLSILDDLPVESSETVILSLSSPSGASLSANITHTLTLTDNDAVSLSIAATDANAAEPSDPGLFTITRSGSTASAVTVNLSRFGSATHGTDYQSLPTSATIGVGQTQATIAVIPIDDLTRENNETISLGITSGSYQIGSPSSATITLVDDEPLLSITATDATADEAGDPAAFTITRSGITSGSLSVNVTFTGTATSGSDFSAISVPVVFAPGSASVVIDVIPVNDSIPEPSETLAATLTSGAYGISGLSSASITLTDDEPFVSLVASDPDAREGVDPGSFTLSRTGSLANDLEVHLTLSGTATNGSDFLTISTPIVIPSGQSSVVIPVTTLDDSAQESYETVTLALTAQPAYTLGSAVSGTVNLQDDDVNNPPVILVTAPSATNVMLASTAVGLWIEANAVDDGLPGSLTTSWTTLTTPAGGSVTFENPGNPTTGVRFSMAGTYALRLSASDGLLSVTHDLRVTVGTTISGALTFGEVGLIDLGSTAGSHSFDGGTVTVSGAGSGITSDNSDGFYYLRQSSTGSQIDIIARITSVTGGASGNGRAGIMMRDGSGQSDLMVFAGITNNGRFCWSYRTTSGGNASVSHTNNISAPRYIRLTRASQSFSAAYSTNGTSWTTPYSVLLNNASQSMSVGLVSTGAGLDATTAVFSQVNLSFTDNTAPVPNAGVDRSARTGVAVTLSGSRTDDGKPVSPGITTTQWLRLSGTGTINFADSGAAATTASFTHPGTHVLRLIASDGQVKTYDDMTATITEDVLNLYAYPGYENMNESGQTPLYVELTRTAPIGDLFVPITYSGTSTPGVDYDALTTQFYLQNTEATSYGSLDVYLDAEVEGTETATVTMLPGPAYVLGPNSTLSWNVYDAPVVTLSATSSVANEHGPVNGVITLTRSGPTTAELVVPLTLSGSATNGIDYTALPASVTIPIGQSSTTVTIVPLADPLIEPEETVIVTANGGIIFGVSGGPATVLLRDPVSVTVASLGNASEAGNVAGGFQLTRIGPVDDALAVSISLSGSAVSGSDFASIPGTQIIPAGETSLTIPVIPMPDSLAEGNESLTLTVEPSPDYQPGAPAADSLILSDRLVDEWRFTAFGADANNPLIAGNNADPDHDGLPNLIEYAIGFQPLTPDPAGTGIVHDLVTIGNQPHLRCTITRNPLAADVILSVQLTNDLTSSNSWSTAGSVTEVDLPTTLIVRDATPLGHISQRFLRVHAAETP
jgi:hypothetical protein